MRSSIRPLSSSTSAKCWVSRAFCGEEERPNQSHDRPKAAADVVLQPVLLLAVGEHVLAGGGGGQLGRRAVLVGGADVEHLVAPRALEAGVDVGRQHRAGQVAQVLDAVDVRQGGGDQDAGHGAGI